MNKYYSNTYAMIPCRHKARCRLMRRAIMVLFTCAIILFTGGITTSGMKAAPEWKTVATTTSEQLETDRIDISVRDGYIYVSTPRNINVKLFSILGHLISSQNINIGTSRIKVPARGIYILKAGTVTRRITV